jgi:hypothetical protein
LGEPTLSVTVCIPFRDRGRDPLRAANLKTVLKHWRYFDVLVVDDDREGDQQFNRCAAYNKATRTTSASVLVFAESDMIIDPHQIWQAIDLAVEAPGMVVPFTEYRYLSETDSDLVRQGADHTTMQPESMISPKTRSWLRTGPINVLTRDTLDMIGQWDETFDGSWWDDRAMKQAFDVAAGPTRWVTGPAYHLYHLPGWTGTHLTDADKAATTRNRLRFHQYRQARTPEQIRQLTMQEEHAYYTPSP